MKNDYSKDKTYQAQGDKDTRSNPNSPNQQGGFGGGQGKNLNTDKNKVQPNKQGWGTDSIDKSKGGTDRNHK